MPHNGPARGMHVRYGDAPHDTGRILTVTEGGGFEVRYRDGETADYGPESWSEFTVITLERNRSRTPAVQGNG